MQPKRLVVIIPSYNEAKGLPKVLGALPALEGYQTQLLVVDNNSRDRTADVARSFGAQVVHEKRQGKGYAMLRGFASIPSNADVVVMIDGDGSYDLGELPRLLELLDSNFCDVVVGSRLHGRVFNGSMRSLNRWGNWLFTFLARVGYDTNVTDVCSGFFAWKAEHARALYPHLTSKSFSLEMEMIAKMAKLGYRCSSVPITYRPRVGASSLRPVMDGIGIMKTWAMNLAWNPRRISTPGVNGLKIPAPARAPAATGAASQPLHTLPSRPWSHPQK